MSTKESIFSIKDASVLMIKRMALRSLGLFLLTALGFALVDLMIDSGMTDKYALVRRFPEMIPLMVAAAKFTFIEMSIFWIRFGTQPRHDVQNAIEMACTTSMGSAIVHLTNTLVWAIRLAVFIYLVG